MVKIFGFVVPGTEPEPEPEPELDLTLTLAPAWCRIIPPKPVSGDLIECPIPISIVRPFSGNLIECPVPISIVRPVSGKKRCRATNDSVAGPSRTRVRARRVRNNQPPAVAEIMPEPLRNRIVNKGGFGIQFVMKKKLYKTDINSGENRFSMPSVTMSFLTEAEKEECRRRRDENKRPIIIGKSVKLITPGGNLRDVTLKQWDYNSSRSFVFCGSWNSIVKEESLEEEQKIQVWFFRNRNGEPCFAMIIVD